MKVCVLTSSFPRYQGDFPGIFLYRLLKALVKSGIDVSVVAPSDESTKDVEVMEGMKVYRFVYWFPKHYQRLAYGAALYNNLKRSFLAKIQLIPFLISFLMKGLKVCRQCDIIHAQTTPVALLAYIIRWFVNKPVIVTPWGTDMRDLAKRFSEYIFDNADAITRGSDIFEQPKGLNFSKYNYTIIPTPIDEDVFNRNVDVTHLKDEFKLKNEFVVTFIARLYAFKAPMTFIKAIPEVLRNIRNVKFLVVGDGVLLDDVKSVVKELGVEDSVFVTGRRNDINMILKVSTIFTAISPIENVWSNTIAEAMFMGVPCIITKAGVSEKFFTHMENCYMIESRNSKTLAEAIVYLLRNPGVREKLAKGGLEFLKEKNKDTSKVVQLTKQLYTKVLRNYKAVA